MQYERITADPNVMFGKPCVKGTRVTVEHILRKLGGGKSPEAIVSDHPNVTVEDVYQAARYAADYMAQEEVTIAGKAA